MAAAPRPRVARFTRRKPISSLRVIVIELSLRGDRRGAAASLEAGASGRGNFSPAIDQPTDLLGGGGAGDPLHRSIWAPCTVWVPRKTAGRGDPRRTR